MNYKYIGIFIGTVTIVYSVGLAYVQNSSRQITESTNISGNESENSTATTITVPVDASQTITISEVAQHGGISSCWSAINGHAYDLTAWIPKHPGGSQAILNICGKDGSTNFNRKHGGWDNGVRSLSS